MLSIFVLLLAVSHAQSVKLVLYNQCPFKIWPGFQGSTIPENGGIVMTPYETRDIYVPDRWTAARIWARTGCDNNMNCETGFCKNSVQCSGAGGVPPVTLVEFTLGGAGNQDFYDVSLVDGYNLVLTVEPIEGTFSGSRNGQRCGKAGICHGDLNPLCPPELSVKNRDNWTVACKSGCLKYNTDRLCCRGQYGNPASCGSNKYAQLFKKQCPTAYSYAYDDKTSTFTCSGSNGRISPDYKIIFCG